MTSAQKRESVANVGVQARPHDAQLIGGCSLGLIRLGLLAAAVTRGVRAANAAAAARSSVAFALVWRLIFAYIIEIKYALIRRSL